MTRKLHEILPIVESLVHTWVGREYAWGKSDCSDLIRDYALALGEPDIKHGWPEYNDAKGAKAAVKSKGYRSYVHALNEHFKPIELPFAMMGDLVGLKGRIRGLEAVGILVGDGTWVLSAFPHFTDYGIPLDNLPAVYKPHPLSELVEKEIVTGRAWRII
jgi:hypothetical protein